MRISVVLPCFNEEENIQQTLEDVDRWLDQRGYDGEIIVVDDGSSDDTPRVLNAVREEYPRLRVIRHTKNQGYGATVRRGCDSASMEMIAFMDSDGQFRAEDFDRLLPALAQYDFVAGVRSHRADPLQRVLSAGLYNILIRLMLGIRVRDVNCAMKVFRRSLWPQIRPMYATGALFNAELFLALRGKGVPWEEVPVPHYPRLHGTSTGGKFSVALRMFRELWALKRSHPFTGSG